MKALIVYDSVYRNTEEIARAIGRALGEETRIDRVEVADADGLGEYEIVIVGSPTQGGRPSPVMKAFLRRIPAGSLRGIDVTGFDTRIDSRMQGYVLRTFMGFLGYAAGRIASQLESKGGRLVVEPAGFFVEAKEGPLRPGEVERAAAWASTIATAQTTSG